MSDDKEIGTTILGLGKDSLSQAVVHLGSGHIHFPNGMAFEISPENELILSMPGTKVGGKRWRRWANFLVAMGALLSIKGVAFKMQLHRDPEDSSKPEIPDTIRIPLILEGNGVR